MREFSFIISSSNPLSISHLLSLVGCVELYCGAYLLITWTTQNGYGPLRWCILESFIRNWTTIKFEDIIDNMIGIYD